jgi:hypothetical protein
LAAEVSIAVHRVAAAEALRRAAQARAARRSTSSHAALTRWERRARRRRRRLREDSGTGVQLLQQRDVRSSEEQQQVTATRRRHRHHRRLWRFRCIRLVVQFLFAVVVSINLARLTRLAHAEHLRPLMVRADDPASAAVAQRRVRHSDSGLRSRCPAALLGVLLAAALAPGCLACVPFVPSVNSTCVSMRTNIPPQLLRYTVAIEARASIILAGITGGDHLRKPCGTTSGDCCRRLTALACSAAVQLTGELLSPPVSAAATAACSGVTALSGYTTCMDGA